MDVVTFALAVKVILAIEGGYANHPLDGETKYGISKKAHPHLNIEKLTLKKAIKIYKEKYWDACEVESVPNEIRLSYFDSCVNIGVFGTKSLWDRVQNDIQILTDFASLPKQFYNARLNYYKRLSNWKVFSEAWTYRLAETSKPPPYKNI